VPTSARRPRHEAGQALVILVLSLFALIGMAGLVIDVGSAWANHRGVQNGADAAAEAGAIVLARRLAGATQPAGGWDDEVSGAIEGSAAANGITVNGAYYTDICGIPLTAAGGPSLNADGSYRFATAQEVGTGLPADTGSTPDCPSGTVGPIAGVIVLGQRDVQTYFSSIFGLNTIPIGSQATAATGFLQESCAAATDEACEVIPVAIPVKQVTCDGTNDAVLSPYNWSADGVTIYKVPLCSNSPGNVGWLDWTPTGGGVSELEQEILNPNSPAITLPSWNYVTATGNINSGQVEAALRSYDGLVVRVPQFDLTCNPGPNVTPNSTQPAINTAPNYGCPAGDLGGNGSNQWYRIPSFANFRLCISTDPGCAAIGADHGAYIQGINTICDTGNGATGCLIGRFESIIDSGTIGPGVGGGTGNSKSIGVQLIK
jgi:hypothetical protein